MPPPTLPQDRGLSARQLNLLFTVGIVVLVTFALRAVNDPSAIIRQRYFTRSNFELLLLFATVLFMGSLYRQRGTVADHLLYWVRRIRNPRLQIIATALLLGAMPVKGRTIMVSPVVSEVAKQHRLGVFPTAMVNHVATHTSYLISPLSSSLVLVVTTASLDFFRFVGYLLPGAAVLITVVSYYAWRVNLAQPVGNPLRQFRFGPALLLTLPLLLLVAALILAEVGKVPYAMAAGSLLFLFLSLLLMQPPGSQLRRALMAMDFALLATLALILLLAVLTANLPAVTEWARRAVASRYTIPGLLTVGYLTGLILGSSTSMVAAVFPVLVPLLGNSPQLYPVAAATYAAQYAGYLASPAHPCCHYVAAYFGKPYLQLWWRIAVVGALAAAAVVAAAWWRS